MDKIKSILVPFDFSKASERGLEYAIDFSGHRPDINLRICFISEDRDASAFQAAFDQIASGISKAFRATLSWTALSHPSVSELLEKSREEKADIIIMGTSGSGDAQTTTKTSETVLSSDCPVLVVPEGTQEEFKLSKIALVLGPREIQDPKLLGTLLDVARSFNAKVTVLTIENQEGTYGYSKEEERNEDLLEYYLESFYSHHAYIKNKDVVKGIFDYVEEHDTDMIAILPRNHASKGKASEGRLTRILTLQSRTPLLAIEH